MNIKIIDVRVQKGDAAFLIDDGKTSILYDTGFGFTGDDVARNIKKVLGERELDFIFLTHSHYDHALGTPYILRSYPRAKVVASTYAADVFKRPGAQRVMKELDNKFAEKCGVTEYDFLGDEIKVDIAVVDGDVIHAGDMDFQIIAIPGHTRCSIGFYCKAKKLLLSAETLGVYDGNETIVPSYLVSYADTIASIEKIKQLDISTILAPHYGILNQSQSAFFLGNMKNAAEKTAQDIVCWLNKGHDDKEIIELFKEQFWHGYIKEIYPEDAANLNTSIMIHLIRQQKTT